MTTKEELIRLAQEIANNGMVQLTGGLLLTTGILAFVFWANTWFTFKDPIMRVSEHIDKKLEER